MQLRELGTSGIRVSTVALGCWPIAGMTTPGIKDDESLATIAACFDLGINFIDTAYCYGPDGESERLIGRALGSRRSEMVIATKGGVSWAPGRKQVVDGRSQTLVRQCEESLRRLATDHVDLLYLHTPDPNTPLAESATGLARLLAAGKARAVGVSNASVARLEEFATVCPIAAVQPAYNMIQRDIEDDLVPWCQRRQVAIVVYWPLAKGLLAGKMGRDHVFAPGDSRHRYPMFQGVEWERNLQLVERLRPIAIECGKTVAQLVVNWTIGQPGITAALCGARLPHQIAETAGAADWELDPRQRAAIEQALAERGPAATRRAV